jgi:hypothetical protein
MAVSVQIDAWEPGGFNFEESYGAMRSCSRNFRITGMTRGSTILAQAKAALDSAGYTTYSRLGDTGPNYNLILVRRNFKTIQADVACTMDGSLEYIAAGECEHNFVLKVRSTIKTIQTCADPFLLINGVGQPFYTGYLYPIDYPFDPTLAGTFCVQGNTLSITIPSAEIRTSGIVSCDDPMVTQHAWINAVNSKSWMMRYPGFWMCTGCESVPWDISGATSKHMFNLSFEYAFEGCWSTYYFVDSATGKVPADVIAGIGIKSYMGHQWLDFNAGDGVIALPSL